MVRPTLVTLALVVGTLFMTSPVAAGASPLQARTPDGEVRTCSAWTKCTARAIGDFNGDGVADLVFEVTTPGARTSNSQFRVELGPWLPAQSNADASALRKPTTQGQITVVGGQDFDPVRAMDVNGDTFDDLVFVTAGDFVRGRSERGTRGIHVVLGGPRWKPALGRVQNARAGVYHFLRGGEFDEVGRLPGTQEVAFADVDGDGAKDLVVGTDVVDGGGGQQSEISIQLNPGAWRPNQDLTPDATIVGLGAGCVGSLVGADDVTGDGLADVVVRVCVDGQPDVLRVVEGRPTWPTLLGSDGGGVAGPRQPDPVERGPRVRPGGGYLPVEPPRNRPGEGPQPSSFATVEDLNGDGLADAALEFAGKLHVWLGGSDIVQRVEAARSSAVILHAGVAGAELTHGWRMSDLNRDGRTDLVLSEAPNPESPDGTAAVLVYANNPLSKGIVDPSFDEPSALWSDPGRVLWGTGDFNGDGLEDLFVGSAPDSAESIYAWIHGPLTGSDGSVPGP